MSFSRTGFQWVDSEGQNILDLDTEMKKMETGAPIRFPISVVFANNDITSFLPTYGSFLYIAIINDIVIQTIPLKIGEAVLISRGFSPKKLIPNKPLTIHGTPEQLLEYVIQGAGKLYVITSGPTISTAQAINAQLSVTLGDYVCNISENPIGFLGKSIIPNTLYLINIFQSMSNMNVTPILPNQQDLITILPSVLSQAYNRNFMLYAGLAGKAYAALDVATNSLITGGATSPGTVGNTTKPIWLNNGVPTEANIDFIFDKVIRTQAQFDELIASPSWLDATSVAFVGEFEKSISTGIKIPFSVTKIQGFNNASISIYDFVYNSASAKGGLWYVQAHNDEGYPERSISDLTVRIAGSGTYVSSFAYCSHLTNCVSLGETPGTYGFSFCDNLVKCNSLSHIGFFNCIELVNCKASSSSVYNFSHGFQGCNNLTNCTATYTYSKSVVIGSGDQGYELYGYNNCENLVNCQANITANITVNSTVGTRWGHATAYGFYGCSRLSNCTGQAHSAGSGIGNTGSATSPALGIAYAFHTCLQLSNCSGDGTSTSVNGSPMGYGFFDCSYTSGCKQYIIASRTSLWGGAGQRRMTDSDQPN